MNATSDQHDAAVNRLRKYAFRVGPSALGLLAFAAVIALFRSNYDGLYFSLLSWWGIPPYPYPFVDTESVLRAIQCWRQGVDVFVPNSCMSGGWYSYSPLLLGAAILPVGIQDRVSVGLVVDVAFLFSISALPACKSWREFSVRTLATLSTVTVFGLERANFDVAIFVLTMAGICLSVGRFGARMLGYGIFVLAAGLKFYPAVLLLLVARERPRTAAAIGSMLIILAGAFLFQTWADTPRAVHLAPALSPFSGAFGARNLPMGLGMLLSPLDDLSGQELARGPIPFLGKWVMALLLLLTTRVAWQSARIDSNYRRMLSPAEESFLIAGAVLVTGCFFAGQNIGYRGIFLLPLFPGLFALSGFGTGTRQRGNYEPLIAAILFLAWADFFRSAEVALQSVIPGLSETGILDFLFWMARELVWWWVVARLCGLVAAFLTSSPLATWLRGIGLPRTGIASTDNLARMEVDR